VKKFVLLMLTFFLTAPLLLAQANRSALMKPAGLKERAPDVYKAKFDTSVGVFVIEVHSAWAPNGADRFYNLVKNGYYDGCRFFRVVPGFMVQFGVNGDPNIQKNWVNATIPDDKVTQGNTRGFVSFAKTPMPNSRTTQIFINDGDNSRLNREGFSPFGKVLSGMEVVGKIFALYGQKPEQNRIQTEGNAYLAKNFPKLDYIKKATIEK